MLGLYVTGHPLEKYENTLKEKTNLNSSMLDSYEDLRDSGIRDGGAVIIGGLIDDVKNQITRNGKLMAFRLPKTVDIVFINVMTKENTIDNDYR